MPTATISIENNYGFHYWTLHAFGRRFWLGQDIKFCRRVLGMEPSYIIEQIGSADLRLDDTRDRLGEFICKALNLDDETAANIDDWGLASE
jgi:hypothetical protein